MDKTSVNLEFAGKTLTLETGKLAPQATSSIMARLGDTMVLVTVVEGKLTGDFDFAGQVQGKWVAVKKQ